MSIKNKVDLDDTSVLVNSTSPLVLSGNVYDTIISTVNGNTAVTLPPLADVVIGQQLTMIGATASVGATITATQAEATTGGNNLVFNEAGTQGSSVTNGGPGKTLVLVVSTATVLTVPNTKVWRVVLRN